MISPILFPTGDSMQGDFASAEIDEANFRVPDIRELVEDQRRFIRAKVYAIEYSKDTRPDL
jgi:hypothetical protein